MVLLKRPGVEPSWRELRRRHWPALSMAVAMAIVYGLIAYVIVFYW